MLDLDRKEQTHVRTALRYLRRRVGSWSGLADALHMSLKTLDCVNHGYRNVTASVALRTARLAGVSLEDLIAGRFASSACVRCGHMPDFADESTIIEDAPRTTGLALVK